MTGEQLLPLEEAKLVSGQVLVTGQYRTWQDGDGVPIRTTVGHPRFWRGPTLSTFPEVAPYGVFKNDKLVTEAEKIAAYRDRLDSKASVIVSRVAELARLFPGERLDLLCYENVWAGEACHRRWFAAWFQERFGIEVPELSK